MLFNSLDFAIFLPVVFFLYWFATSKSLKLQNFLIVAASYFFYGSWDYRFLSLIFISSIVDYLVGMGLGKTESENKRKLLLAASLTANLGMLGFFKYFNFFAANFASAFSLFGHPIHPSTLSIVLPVGISFYTFQTLSYSIDVYRKKMEPTKDLISFLAFVSFFPQLVAGPIERASNLLPQFYRERKFVYADAVSGMRQILWGLFKKVVIADNCAKYVDSIYGGGYASGLAYAIATILFAFQIYCDFSGYSDMAIGISRLFGFSLMKNFAYPYFARDIAEFWRRWHISLTTWFRDYIYIPLGGSRTKLSKQIVNTWIVFLVSGFWHGANWTFVAWGALNALYFMPLLLLGKNRQHLSATDYERLFPSLKTVIKMVSTFLLAVFAWIFFRAKSISEAFYIIKKIFSKSLFESPGSIPYELFLLVFVLLLFEWAGRREHFAIEKIGQNWPRPARWAFYTGVVFVIGIIMSAGETPFIYFQF